MRTSRSARLAVASLLLIAGPGAAEPVKVRLLEGNTRGFLVVSPPGEKPIGHGELRQKPTGATIETRLVLNFKDGSLFDETVTFSQKDVFRVESYRLVQRGSAFPTTEVSFDRRSGRYRARVQAKKGAEEETASGPLEMPADLYNGMALVLLKNLPPGSGTTAQQVAFTPSPRLLRMMLTPEGDEKVFLGGQVRPVTRYLVKLEIGGLTGAVASLIGKEPPDLRYWLVTGEVPAFVRFEGAMFLKGPVWRLDLTSVEWPK